MDDEFGVVLQARKFVEEAGIDSIPVDLDRYLSMDGVNAKCKVDNGLADDEAGQTAVISGRHCIFVNGRHSRERQRFYYLPRARTHRAWVTIGPRAKVRATKRS